MMILTTWYDLSETHSTLNQSLFHPHPIHAIAVYERDCNMAWCDLLGNTPTGSDMAGYDLSRLLLRKHVAQTQEHSYILPLNQKNSLPFLFTMRVEFAK